jgi:SAM-dependent methyltransferase
MNRKGSGRLSLCFAIVAVVLLLYAAPAAAAAQGEPSRSPDVAFVPTPLEVVDVMLRLADVKPTDVVYDLGCGDGRIVIAAAKRGARAVGYDIDPERVRESRENVKKAGVEHLVKIEQRDIFTLDLRGASVITLYLLPQLNVRLIPQLEKLTPGTRIVSHAFDMGEITPEVKATVSTSWGMHSEVFYWTAPLKK